MCFEKGMEVVVVNVPDYDDSRFGGYKNGDKGTIISVIEYASNSDFFCVKFDTPSLYDRTDKRENYTVHKSELMPRNSKLIRKFYGVEYE